MFSTGWLYLENRQMPLIWRCVGFCVLMNGLVAAGFASVAKPYLVPTMSFIGPSITLSPSGFNIYLLVWLGTAFCGVPMMVGSRNKFWPIFAIIAMAILGAMEYTSISCSFIVITCCYLVALLFDRAGPSPAARLIQIAVSATYLISAIHKIHPEWLNGETMISIMRHGWNVYSIWMPLLNALNITTPVAQFLSILTIATEVFLAVAFWFDKTRKAAAIVGVLFHIALTITLFGIIPFLPTMLTGYLAFFKNTTPQEQPSTRVEPALALALVALMVLAPLRFAVLDKPLMHLSFMDWTPWSMAMFLYDEKVRSVDVAWQGADGVWHEEAKSGRMNIASADKDMKALVHYVLTNHSEAVAAKADTKLMINRHWSLEKSCSIKR